MAKVTISVHTDDVHKERLAKAAKAAGMSVSKYLLKAADERMMRDATAQYRQILADSPEFAAEVADARRIAMNNAARVRGQVMTRHRVTG